MIKKIPAMLLVLFLVGCAQTKETPKSYSIEEVQKHNTKEGCWLAIDGKVYDVSSFVSSHPGGDALLEGCGKDATELYETRPMGSGTPHSERARDMLEGYYIGGLE